MTANKSAAHDADDRMHYDVDWKAIDWGSSDYKHLPWHKHDDAAVSTKDRGAKETSAQAPAAPDYKVNRSLPWLRDAPIEWGTEARQSEANISNRLLAYSHYANQFEDINTVIELMLTEARDATHADGGTFYLVSPEEGLRFSYFQNRTLSRGGSESRNHYVNAVIPINDRSICGYVALTKQTLNIESVERLPEDAPYSFNRSFDESSGYNTISMLTVPVTGTGGKVLAVLQLINSLDPNGVPKSFDESDVRYSELLAFQSVPYLTKSLMTRRLIDTMLRISEMRDPLETGAHVQRVGAFAAEIYEQWGRDHRIPTDEIMMEKSTLRLAAMLHDIGKVAIPDAILKKPAKLTDDEYAVMKTHCARGAQMYAQAESPLEHVAYEITLYHHQRWDGKGYTGDPDIPNLSGAHIPLYARITSAADVLDALAFPRVYKPAWTFDDALEELKKCAGTQFDPEVVQAAVNCAPTLKAIVDMYK